MSTALPAIVLCAVLALLGLGIAGARTAAGRLLGLTVAAAAVCAITLALLLLAPLAAGDRAAAPLVLAGVIAVSVDALSLPPLAIVFFAAFATLAAAIGCETVADRRTRLLLGPLAACWALVLLAADALTQMVGLLAAGAASWAITGGRNDSRPGNGVAVLLAGLIGLLVAIDLLIGNGLSYAAMRALPMTGWRAGGALLASVAGVAILVVRLTAWPSAAGQQPGRPPLLAGALLGAVLPAAAGYLLLRLLLDVAGPTQPLAWGVPILLAGIGVALSGAAEAIRAAGLAATLTAATRAQCGLTLIGIGLVAMARAADQPDLAAFALAGTLVALIAHAVFKCLLMVAAASIRHGAGTDAYGALGGTSRSMPVSTACLLAGAFSLAALPLSAGFVGAWTLLQSLFAAPRLGGAAIQLLELAAALAVALTAALLAHASVRLVGIGLLGRPRTPRAAAAAEAPRGLRRVLVGLAALSLALGIWPAAMFALAAPATRALTATPLGSAATWLTIAPPPDLAGYVPLGVAALFAGVWAILQLLRRAMASPAARQAPVWADGYAAPPAWLPFGDPALQYDAASFSAGPATAFAAAGRGVALAMAPAVHAAAPRRLHPAFRQAVVRWRPVVRRHRLALALLAVILGLVLLALAVAVFGTA